VKVMRKSGCEHWILAVVVAGTLIGYSLPLRAASACSMDDLAFMQGDWLSAEGPGSGEERWVLTPANTLAGSAWEAKGTTLSFAEALSILPQNDRIELRMRHFDGSLSHAWEEKDSPMVFALAQCDGRSAVFDGTGSKVGEHITYRKTAEGLTFVGDFLHQGRPVHVELHMRPGTK
jgi:hypothetical protein